jgi:hypothetical protein
MTKNKEDDKDEVFSLPKYSYSRLKTWLLSAFLNELANKGSNNKKLKKKVS